MRRNKIKSLLPAGTGAMWLHTYRKGGVVRIEASMCPGTSGVELTDLACRTLSGFFTSYHEAHGLDPSGDYFDPSRDPKKLFVAVGWEGVTVDVLPEHADELATRIAVFSTDPANHDPVDFGWTFVTADLKRLKKWTTRDAEVALKKCRREVETTWPELVADPLGTLPNDTAAE